jgi:thioredoxin
MHDKGGKMKKSWVLILMTVFVFCSFSVTFTACAGSENNSARSTSAANDSPVKTIQSEKEFKKIIGSSPDRLMVFDLYADWCRPCRVLSPMLAEIARENKARADFYKIDVDRLPGLAGAFKVRGIPHVAFLKNKTILHAFVGVQTKSAYVRAVNMLSEQGDEKQAAGADGEIINGIRVIHFKAGINPHSIYVYRGETVKLVMEKQDFPFSVHLPDFNISRDAGKNESLEITFKVKKVGVYPIFCNGNCPAGDGALHGKVIVMQYKAGGKAQFTELTAAEARALIEKKDPLILDVRTPQEFYSGHLQGAKLIPLQQLVERLSEIRDYKDRDIVVYCRSGNRSTVAGELLIREGFKKIYNIRSGIRGWINDGFPVEKVKAEAVKVI